MQKQQIIRNNLNRDISVLVDGALKILPAGSERAVSESLALQFLTEYPGNIELIGDPEKRYGTLFSQPNAQEFVIVANMLGDPDAPAEVKQRSFNGKYKVWEDVPVPNPKKEARSIVREMDLGQDFYVGMDGEISGKNNGKEVIKLPAFQQTKLKKNVAEWFLERDNHQTKISRGSVTRSRELPAFRPNHTWKLDDIRAYLRLMDVKATIGPGELEIPALYQQEQKNAEVEGRDPKTVDEFVFDIKDLALRRLYFRLVDPQYPIRSETEYRAFLTSFKADEARRFNQKKFEAERANETEVKTKAKEK